MDNDLVFFSIECPPNQFLWVKATVFIVQKFGDLHLSFLLLSVFDIPSAIFEVPYQQTNNDEEEDDIKKREDEKYEEDVGYDQSPEQMYDYWEYYWARVGSLQAIYRFECLESSFFWDQRKRELMQIFLGDGERYFDWANIPCHERTKRRA